MHHAAELEQRLEQSVERASAGGCPPKLAAALRYAVFPGGGRVRPLLTLAVARASGGEHELALRGAVAVELIHCASLVHDDMPCFDDAQTRRGKLTVHRAFGEEIALLVGDALITLAFEELSQELAQPLRSARQVQVLARGLGPAHGIIGGQAWESEPQLDLGRYHRAKTGALFEAAAELGALAAGVEGEPWRRVGQLIGEAYQLADDLADAAGEAISMGKATGQDARSGAPNAVERLGVLPAVQRLEQRVLAAQRAVPPCPGRAELVELVAEVGRRLCPARLRVQPIARHGAVAAA